MKHIPEWPSTSNAVESKNARLRETLRLHRGLPLLHRIKAIWVMFQKVCPKRPRNP